MVYQSTVLGPVLWNTFFSDVAVPATRNGEQEIMFADDLNIFKFFPRNASDATIEEELHNTRRRVHKWGKLNRVAFDPGKEQVIIISPGVGSEDVFKMLGITFDGHLSLKYDIDGLLSRVRPKVKALLRTRSFYTDPELVSQFKTHI